MNASLQADNSAWVCLCVSAQCYSRALLSVQLTLRLAVGTPCRRSWHNGRTVTALISLGYDSYLCGRLVHLSSHRPATLRQTPVAFQVGSVYRSIYFTYLDVFFFLLNRSSEESSLFKRCLVRELFCRVLDSPNWKEHRCEETKSVKCLFLWRYLCGGNSCKVLCAALPWNYAHWKPSPSCSQASAMRGRWSSRSMSVFVSLIVLWQTR